MGATMSAHPIHSRIQLVIVLAISGLVVALAIFTIQKMRDAAAQMQFSNNLKQLGLGLQNYNSAPGLLPPLVDYGTGSKTGQGLPSIFFLLQTYIKSAPVVFWIGAPAERYHSSSTTEYVFPREFSKEPPIVERGGAANQVYWRCYHAPADTIADKLRDIVNHSGFS